MKILYCIFIINIFLIIDIVAQTPSITHDQEYVCPNGPGITYFLESTIEVVSAQTRWSVNNGSFSATNENDTVCYTYVKQANVNVYWKKAKKGTLTAKVLYTTQSGQSLEKITSITQKIKTLKGVTPPRLSAILDGKEIKSIEFGTQHLKISLTDNIFYPDVIEGGRPVGVSNIEWTLPDGWKDSHGNTNTFVSSEGEINVITDEVTDGTIKLRGVSNCIEDDKSDYTTLSISRKFEFLKYPDVSEIKYGIAQTFNYIVSDIKGYNYEWSVPADWNISSGINSNSIMLNKSACATSADIRIRLIDIHGNTSKWYICPNKSLIYPSLNISGETKQYKAVNISIDIPEINLQSFTLVGNGLSVDNLSTANTLKCTFSQSGDIEVTATVQLKECNDPLILKKTISIEKSGNLSINGNAIICSWSQAIYSFENYIPGMQWRVSNNLKIISGQGTQEITVGILNEGDASINLDLPGDGRAYKRIFAGKPMVSSIYGNTNVALGVFTCFEALPDYNFIYNTNEVGYIWEIDKTSGIDYQIEGNKICVTFRNDTYNIYRFSCRTNSACGSGMPQKIDVSISPRYMISVKSGIITIQTNGDLVSQSYSTKTLSGISYRLINISSGICVKNGQINKNGDSIDCTNLLKGTYLLKIMKENNEYDTHKINL